MDHIDEALAKRAFLKLEPVDQERVLAQAERIIGLRDGKALAVLAAVGALIVSQENAGAKRRA